MKIREFLDSQEKWTKGMSARDFDEKFCDVFDRKAVSWCLYGAIIKCYLPGDNVTEKVRKVCSHLGIDLVRWNDAPERTFEDVRKIVETLDI